jgi:seryl-tRNA synthetase
LDSTVNTDFRSELLASGLLVDTGVDGLYLRSGKFETVVRGIDNLISSAGADQNASVLHLPAVLPRILLERSGYLRSFPDLLGSVSVFVGDDDLHVQLLERLGRGENWVELLTPSDLALCSAACHAVYPLCSGRLAASGRRFEVFGHCFRHEPSPDPDRMQAFRMHEFVYLGDPDGAVAHRNLWLERSVDLLSGLGLTVEVVVANDPFFGRAGRLLALSQRSDTLKCEVVCTTQPDAQPTAIASSNYHVDHFGIAFGIESANGDAAHTACVGFGAERVTLALLHTHGLDPDRWPPQVRSRLWP